MSSPIRVVLTTVADQATAEKLATAAVEQKVAACVNILPPMRSIYRWENKVHREEEILLLFKTTEAAIPLLAEVVREIHPYELPEFVVLDVDLTGSRYAEWIVENTRH
jgi:periplasmic divalent cation tolerance protein